MTTEKTTHFLSVEVNNFFKFVQFTKVTFSGCNQRFSSTSELSRHTFSDACFPSSHVLDRIYSDVSKIQSNPEHLFPRTNLKKEEASNTHAECSFTSPTFGINPPPMSTKDDPSAFSVAVSKLRGNTKMKEEGLGKIDEKNIPLPPLITLTFPTVKQEEEQEIEEEYGESQSATTAKRLLQASLMRVGLLPNEKEQDEDLTLKELNTFSCYDKFNEKPTDEDLSLKVLNTFSCFENLDDKPNTALPYENANTESKTIIQDSSPLRNLPTSQTSRTFIEPKTSQSPLEFCPPKPLLDLPIDIFASKTLPNKVVRAQSKPTTPLLQLVPVSRLTREPPKDDNLEEPIMVSTIMLQDSVCEEACASSSCAWVAAHSERCCKPAVLERCIAGTCDRSGR